jgi:nitrite reductase/ring-hydroxylating ferredoxin subunit
MPETVRVASVSELPPGSAREVTVGDRVIALFNADGEICALDGLCMHSGGPLAKGTLRGEVITCPWHGWQFNVKTGRHCLAPRIRQPQVNVEVRGDEIYVSIDDESPAPPESAPSGGQPG